MVGEAAGAGPLAVALAVGEEARRFDHHIDAQALPRQELNQVRPQQTLYANQPHDLCKQHTNERNQHCAHQMERRQKPVHQQQNHDETDDIDDKKPAVLCKRPQHTIGLKSREQNRNGPNHKDRHACGIRSCIQECDQRIGVHHKQTHEREKNERQFSRRIVPEVQKPVVTTFPQVVAHMDHHYIGHWCSHEIHKWNLQTTDGINRECGCIEMPRNRVLMIVLLNDLKEYCTSKRHSIRKLFLQHIDIKSEVRAKLRCKIPEYPHDAHQTKDDRTAQCPRQTMRNQCRHNQEGSAKNIRHYIRCCCQPEILPGNHRDLEHSSHEQKDQVQRRKWHVSLQRFVIQPDRDSRSIPQENRPE